MSVVLTCACRYLYSLKKDGLFNNKALTVNTFDIWQSLTLSAARWMQRKKKNRNCGKMQKKSGRTERDVAHRVAQRTGFHPGVVEAVLAATGEIIEEELSDGRSVTLRGIGSFQTAVTSKGFEHPEDVLPHSVRLSRVYFKADRMLTLAVKRAGCHRIPFKYYFPKELLTKKMELADKQAEREEDEMDGAECS